MSKVGERTDKRKMRSKCQQEMLSIHRPNQQPLLVSRRDRQGGSVSWVLNYSPGSVAFIEKNEIFPDQALQEPSWSDRKKPLQIHSGISKGFAKECFSKAAGKQFSPGFQMYSK